MELRIFSIDPKSAAKVIAAITFALSWFAVLLSLLAMPFGATVNIKSTAYLSHSVTGAWWAIVFTPFISYIFTFISTYIACLLYNWMAPHVGPIVLNKGRIG